jgi:hypothetical protein
MTKALVFIENNGSILLSEGGMIRIYLKIIACAKQQGVNWLIKTEYEVVFVGPMDDCEYA